MTQAPRTDRAAAAKALLAWWVEAGVETPPPSQTAPAHAAPAQAAAVAPAAKPAPSARKSAAPPQAGAVHAAIDAARTAAAAAQDVDALAAAIAAFDGCELKKTARNTVVCAGPPCAPVMVIGEAPGADEDAAGSPFVGRAGKLLDKMLATVGLSRETNTLITNAVYWRPPRNRNPSPDELAICRPFVDRMITLVQPKAVLLLGGVAAKSLLGVEESVTALRGKRHDLSVYGLTISVNALVTWHPAYLLRQPGQKRLTWADLLAFSAWLDELGAARGQAP